MRFRDASLMLKPRDPCPVCGAETALVEIEPHPLHVNYEIHGYLCDRCGPIKSLVVLRSPSASIHDVSSSGLSRRMQTIGGRMQKGARIRTQYTNRITKSKPSSAKIGSDLGSEMVHPSANGLVGDHDPASGQIPGHRLLGSPARPSSDRTR
jgi:hypothetical protein